MEQKSVLNTNSIAFIGLCNEYCMALENCRETEQEEFIESMLKLLPRLYISATDLTVNYVEDEEPYIDNILDEDYYESIRRGIEQLMGEHDVYLEVFEEDMKYSDTPVSRGWPTFSRHYITLSTPFATAPTTSPPWRSLPFVTTSKPTGAPHCAMCSERSTTSPTISNQSAYRLPRLRARSR